jgi:hypothetical protein
MVREPRKARVERTREAAVFESVRLVILFYQRKGV